MKIDDQKRIALNLKYLRTIFQYTQEELAEKLYISTPAYYRYESGTQLPSIDFFYDLSKLYHLPVEVILETDKNEFAYKVALHLRTPKALKKIVDIFEDLSVMSQGKLVEYARLVKKYNYEEA